MKKYQCQLLLIVFILGLAFSSQAQQELPFCIPNEEIVPLRSLKDEAMQDNLKAILNENPKWAKLIRDKKMSVGLVDLKDSENIRYAAVNGEEMMYAASLPKIAILLAAMDAIEKGELTVTKSIKADMNAMIRKSNNQASTRMIDLLGYDKIEAVLTDPLYELYDEDFGGGLWVGKRYAAAGARNPDPIKGLSHAASVSQVCRFYYLMAMGKLVTEQRSKEMLEIMVDPGLHHKFVNSLDQLAPAAQLYRKSGSWRSFHADSVLVWGKNKKRRYILVALTDDPDGEQIIRKLVRKAEKVLQVKDSPQIAGRL